MKLTRGGESIEKEAILKNVVVVDAGSDIKVPVKVFFVVVALRSNRQKEGPVDVVVAVAAGRKALPLVVVVTVHIHTHMH